MFNDFGCDMFWFIVGFGIMINDLVDFVCCILFWQGCEIVLCVLWMMKGWVFGFEIGICEKIILVGFVGYVMLMVVMIGDVVNIGLVFQKDIGSMLEFDKKDVVEGVVYIVVSCFYDLDIYVFLVEEVFVSFMGIGCELVGQDFWFLCVDFVYFLLFYVSEYVCIFGCDICFGQLENVFVCEV